MLKRALRIVVLGWLWLILVFGLVLIAPIALLIGYALSGSWKENWDEYLETYIWVVREGGKFLWSGP